MSTGGTLEQGVDEGYTGDAYAWALALAPALLVLIALAAVQSGRPTVEAWSVAAIVTVVVNVALATLDASTLRRRGLGNLDMLYVYAVLLVPLYLVMRTRWAKSTPAIPMVWVATLLVTVVVGASLVPQRVEVTAGDVEEDVSRWFGAQYGIDAAVSCPEPGAVSEDDEIRCWAKWNRRQAAVFVQFSADGSYEWTVSN